MTPPPGSVRQRVPAGSAPLPPVPTLSDGSARKRVGSYPVLSAPAAVCRPGPRNGRPGSTAPAHPTPPPACSTIQPAVPGHIQHTTPPTPTTPPSPSRPPPTQTHT